MAGSYRGSASQAQIQNGIQSLAQMFAPPSAQDLYAASKAAETKQAIQLKNDMASLDPKDPNYKSIADKFYALTGVAPHYYDIDQTQATSRANNAVDNRTKITTTEMQQRGETDRALLAPVGAGATRFVPPSIADMYKLEPTQTGVVNVGQGDTATLPDGRVIKGADKPLTESEVKAAAFGRLTPEEQRLAVAGASKDVHNYIGPNGEVRIARLDPSGKLVDTQTGLDVEPGGKTYNATAQGTPDQFGGKTTEAQDKTAYAAKMAEDATKQVLLQFDTPGQLPDANDYQLSKMMERLPAETYPSLIQKMSPKAQTFYQGIRTALPLQLMVQSGLATTDKEAERKQLELVPIPGEDPKVTLMKRKQFENFVHATRGLAATSIKKIEGQGAPSPVVPAPAPTGGGAKNWVISPDGKLVPAP